MKKMKKVIFNDRDERGLDLVAYYLNQTEKGNERKYGEIDSSEIDKEHILSTNWEEKFPGLNKEHKLPMLNMLTTILALRDSNGIKTLQKGQIMNGREMYDTMDKLANLDQQEFNILGYFIDKDIIPSDVIYHMISTGTFAKLRKRNEQDIIKEYLPEIEKIAPEIYFEIHQFFSKFSEMTNEETMQNVQKTKHFSDFLGAYGQYLKANMK